MILTQEEIAAFNQDIADTTGTMVIDLKNAGESFDGIAKNQAIQTSATADAEYYTTVTAHDCNLTGEWWEKFSALPPEKMEQAKAIIALNQFKDGDYECDDKEVCDVLSYYKITRDDTEND